MVGHSGLNISHETDSVNRKNIFIFGGWDGNKYSDTSYLLNYEKNTLKVSYYEGWNTSFSGVVSKDKNQKKINNTKSHGDSKYFCSDIPPSRRDHTLTYDSSDNKVYLFGGWNSLNWGFEENEFNELWVLDNSN